MARKILKALTNNFGYKFLALFLAFILWIVVYNLEDPTKTKSYTVTVTTINEATVTKEMNKWYEIVEGTNQVSFTVSAKRSILEKLDDSDFTAVADFNTIVLSEDGTKGTVGIDISCNKTVYNSSLNINAKSKNLVLSLEGSMKQQFKVVANTSGTVADGFALGDVKVTKSQLITVSGPESIVSQIEKIVATINISGMYDEITDDNIIPVLYDRDGKEVPTTRLELSSNSVTITAQILGTREIPINFTTTGQPEGENEVMSVTSSASSVLVKGSAAALNALTSIDVPAEVLDVTGATEDIVKTIDIKEYLPEGISLVNVEDANISVTVKIKSISSRSVNISTDNITVEGLQEGYELEFASAVFSVKITGPDKDLAALTADKIKGVIDVSSMAEGTHQINVVMQLDESKFTYNAVSVKVIIRQKTQDTNEPENPDDVQPGQDDEPSPADVPDENNDEDVSQE